MARQEPHIAGIDELEAHDVDRPREGGLQPPQAPRIRLTRLTAALVALAAIATIQAALTGPRVERHANFDERRFEQWANNLYYHGFYGDTADSPLAIEEMRSVPYSAYVPPGYPFFLIGLKAAHAGGSAPLRAAQALMVGLIVLAAGFLALRMFGPIAAVLSGVLLIATGVLATYAQFMLSEILATATLFASVALAVAALRRRSWRLSLGAGLLLGYSILVRPQALLLPFPIAAALFLFAGRRKIAALLAVVFLAGSFGVVAPWTIRNEARLHAFVPVTTYTWINFWESNNPHATGLFRLPERWIGPDAVRQIRSLPEVQQDDVWRKMALEWVKAHPSAAVLGWARDTYLFMDGADPWIASYYRLHGVAVPRFDERPIMWLALLTIILALVRRRDLTTMAIPILVVAYFLAFFSLFIATARFRVPVIPVIAVLAAGLPEVVIGMVSARRRKRVPDIDAGALHA